MNKSPEGLLFNAVQAHDIPAISRILRDNPGLDINRRSGFGTTALQRAVMNDEVEIVELLLAQPGIDVNARSTYGNTAFSEACFYTGNRCGRVLLRDPRVDLAMGKSDTSPLCMAVVSNPELVRWWIASGREMDLGTPGDGRTDAIASSRRGPPWIRDLLLRFRDDPAGTRREVRVGLGLYDDMAAEVFAPVVFVSDGILRLPQNSISGAKTLRFFRIMVQLPLELQMLISYRAVGSARILIPLKAREEGFRYLAKGLLPRETVPPSSLQ
jgi:hypothetical protein